MTAHNFDFTSLRTAYASGTTPAQIVEEAYARIAAADLWNFPASARHGGRPG